MTAAGTETVHLGVGIDTARYGHCVSFLTEDRQPAAGALAVSESADGYRQLEQQLKGLYVKYPQAQFHVHLDAAGQYATNLEQFLRGLPLPMSVSVGQPKQNKDYHRALFPKRKTDATESHAMARFGVVERPAASPALCAEIYILREIAGRLEARVRDTTQAINRLHNLLSRVFPELATIVPNIASGWVLRLLAKYATPQRMAQARQTSLEKIPYIPANQAARIQAAAHGSVGSLRGELAEQLVRQAVLEVQHSQQAEQKLEELLLQAYRGLPHSGHVQLETIPGIGRVTAAVLAAKIVSIDRFASPEKLVGYFGVFPEEHSSGIDRQGRSQSRATHMSRKGNDLVRRYLFCAARSAIRHNPAVRALYARLRARGTRGDVALGHAMRKLLHLVFAVWATDKPFDENHYRWEAAGGETAIEEQSAEAAAQEQAAGPKRDVLPTRTEVTAACSTVDRLAPEVNGQQTQQAADIRRGSIDYAYLRSQITIEEVLRRIGHFDALRGSTQRRGPCPFHETGQENSHSFSVNLRKNVFRCLNPNCATHGNALDLWAAHTGLPIYQAALSLADAFHLEVKPDQRRGNP